MSEIDKKEAELQGIVLSGWTDSELEIKIAAANERLRQLNSGEIALNIQQERELVLKKVLFKLKEIQPDINFQALPYSRVDMLKILEVSELFKGISEYQFKIFFEAQKLCRLRKGRPRKN
jgi:hypothetical protein